MFEVVDVRVNMDDNFECGFKICEFLVELFDNSGLWVDRFNLFSVSFWEVSHVVVVHGLIMDRGSRSVKGGVMVTFRASDML
jgi:hypothetical protein